MIDNPPVNVISAQFLRELRSVLTNLESNAAAKVIIFESRNPEYFIAHFDFSLIDDMEAFGDLAELAPPGLNFAQALSEQVRHQPQVTIVKLRGTVRGGGSEFVLAADMCFASPEARISQCEALMGVVPGGGGTQYLAERIGRNRALEAILRSDPFDAKSLEKYGCINRVIPAEDLDTFIGRLSTTSRDCRTDRFRRSKTRCRHPISLLAWWPRTASILSSSGVLLLITWCEEHWRAGRKPPRGSTISKGFSVR